MNELIGKGRRGVLLGLALVALGLFVPGAARADDAAALYDPGKVYRLDLTLTPQALTALGSAPSTYQPAELRWALPGAPGVSPTWSAAQKTEIRLKGNASFRPLSGKAAFKLKFGKKPEERFFGLRKLTLNNMVEDRSMVHETLAYTTFRAAGLAASRTGYVYLTLNGEDFGVYLNVENLDDIALARIYGSFDAGTQHLYEGENGADVEPGGAGDFALDEGDDSTTASLEALITAANSTTPGTWSERLAAHADLAQMTRFWAVEKYSGHWDGYAGEAASAFQPNNYYLLSDPSGKFQMLPWGSDETWTTALGRIPFDGKAGLLFNNCLADAACAALYRANLRAVRNLVAGLDLDGLATRTAALLAPWQAHEHTASTREEYTPTQIAAGVADTRAFLAARPGEADAWLGPETGGTDPKDSGGPGGGPGGDSRNPALALRLIRVRAHPQAVWSKFRVGAPGQLAQYAQIRTVAGPLRFCGQRARVRAAGVVTRRCALPSFVTKRLRARWVRVELITRFVPNGGTNRALRSAKVLPRT